MLRGQYGIGFPEIDYLYLWESKCRGSAKRCFCHFGNGHSRCFFEDIAGTHKRGFKSRRLPFQDGRYELFDLGAWFFLFCLLFMLIVSLLTKAPDREKIVNLTFGTITGEEKKNNKSSYNWVDVTISIVILLIVIGVMIFFNRK